MRFSWLIWVGRPSGGKELRNFSLLPYSHHGRVITGTGRKELSIFLRAFYTPLHLHGVETLLRALRTANMGLDLPPSLRIWFSQQLSIVIHGVSLRADRTRSLFTSRRRVMDVTYTSRQFQRFLRGKNSEEHTTT